mmetsp:Transcript_9317/g.11784  ORF Transcript_9317/g.11784 Transcript_9317/m.11784 type:complete len:347 (+) Transcript_9317:112-1152(+)
MSTDQSGPDHEMLQQIVRSTVKAMSLIGTCLLYYFGTIPIFAFFSALQERKIWKNTATPLTFIGLFKVFVFNVLWMLLTGITALSLFPMWLSRGLEASSVAKEMNAVMEKLVGMGLQYALIGPVKIINQDKIPDIRVYNPDTSTPAPVFIANHGSQLDLCIIYFVIRRFKWIAKQSVKYLPGVGFGMTLGNHIFIKRTGKNSSSVSNLYEESNLAIQSGIPMMLFPQGTRRMNTRLPFKYGAFKIAIENETKIVPMSINIPLDIWNSYYPLNLLWSNRGEEGQKEEENVVTITIHDPIQVTKDTNIEELKKQCDDIIYSALAPHYRGKESTVGQHGTQKEEKLKKK